MAWAVVLILLGLASLIPILLAQLSSGTRYVLEYHILKFFCTGGRTRPFFLVHATLVQRI